MCTLCVSVISLLQGYVRLESSFQALLLQVPGASRTGGREWIPDIAWPLADLGHYLSQVASTPPSPLVTILPFPMSVHGMSHAEANY